MVLVTGSTSSLARLVIKELPDSKVKVISSHAFNFRLGQTLPDDALQNADAVVHFGYDKTKRRRDSVTNNVLGTARIIKQAAAANKRFIFISSDSAKFNTLYGRNKRSVEKLISGSCQAASLRIGLVDAKPFTGIFGNILRISDLCSRRIEIESERNFTVTTPKEIAACVLKMLVVTPLTGTWNSGDAAHVSLAEAVKKARPEITRRIKVLSVRQIRILRAILVKTNSMHKIGAAMIIFSSKDSN